MCRFFTFITVSLIITLFNAVENKKAWFLGEYLGCKIWFRLPLLEDEVRKLSRKYSWDCPAMLSIGYREWKDYFSNTKTKDRVVTEIQQDTRNYAKRQMTWFWRMEKRQSITWVSNETEAKSAILKFLDF